MQPDSIIPDLSNPQSGNRYSYTLNNPIRYTDPTGHWVFETDDPVHEKLKIAQKDAKKRRDRNDEKDRREELDYNGWDLLPGVSDIRQIIRGSQIMDLAQNQAGFYEQQEALIDWQNHCYGLCHYSDAQQDTIGVTVGGPMPNTPLVDNYSEGMGDVANGVVNLGLLSVTTGVAVKTAPVQSFARGGPQWHVGLETTKNMNIVHIGNHAKYGIHIAFGAVRPYAANLHIYVQKAFPFFRIWKP